MIPIEKLDQLIARHEELEHLMAEGTDLSSADFVAISKEYSELSSVVRTARTYQETVREIADLEDMLADRETDPEMRELAELELPVLKTA